LQWGWAFAAGLRALTPPAVVAWAAYLGWLNLHNSPLAFMGSIITAVIFSLLALFELFGDLQPSTPKRTRACAASGPHSDGRSLRCLPLRGE